jgi:sigma-B regulation protein RsbU (phosphoserine phosphatase)
MLPEQKADVEGVKIFTRYAACSELGGDMLDYSSAGHGRAAVMVADVAGHGVSAALLTAVVKSAFGSSAGDAFEPRAVVRRVARDIAYFGPRRFVTLMVARIDCNAGRLDYVSAGHPPSLLWSSAEDVRQLDSTGPLISPAFGDDEWEQKSVDISAGTHLLLYTDGITETAGDAGQFSRQRLIEQVRLHPGGGAALLDAILSALRAHAGGRPPLDDLTLLVASPAKDS